MAPNATNPATRPIGPASSPPVEDEQRASEPEAVQQTTDECEDPGRPSGEARRHAFGHPAPRDHPRGVFDALLADRRAAIGQDEAPVVDGIAGERGAKHDVERAIEALGEFEVRGPHLVGTRGPGGQEQRGAHRVERISHGCRAARASGAGDSTVM